MSFFELFNGTPVDSLDDDHRIAFNKPAIKGAKNVTWVNFRTILSGFFMNLTGNQTVNGDKTFTGRIVGRTPLSDSELATKKYVDDNAGGGEEIIEVDTYANLPAIGVNSVLYIVLDENVQYRWTGSAYIKMSNPLSYATEAEALAGTDNTKVMTSLRVNEQWNHNVVNEIVDDLDTTDKTLQGGINELAARAVFSVCEQSDVEQAIPTENTKATSALRAWQGLVYWVKNTSFSGLTTTAKTVQGAINELAVNTLKGNTTVHTTPIAADSIGILDSVAGLFKRIPLSSIKTFVLNGLTTTQVSNTSTNVTGNTVTDVFDNMVRYTQSDTVPQNPRNKDLWLDTSNTRQPVLYQYFIDENADGFWVCFDISGKNEIPNITSGEKVVTKSTTGVNVNKDMIDMQIAAGTIASANWITGKATYSGQQGQVTYDNNYKYECIGTNLWIRTSVVQAVMDLYLADIDDSGGAKTSAELNSAYSTAQIGQRVWGSQFLYEKKNATDWKKITAVTA